MIISSSSGEYAFKKVFLLASKWVQETGSILSTFCPPRARNALLFRLARKSEFSRFCVTRRRPNLWLEAIQTRKVTRVHARKAFRESLPNEASVVMMRRVRVGFLYVTLRLNAAAFSNSKTRLLSLVLFFVLIYLCSLHLSSHRTFLIGAPAQESISKVRFCASFALGRPQRRTLSSTSSSTTQEIISRFLFFVSLFFPPFREFHRRNELGTNQRDLFNDWQLLPNEVHQFLSEFG